MLSGFWNQLWWQQIFLSGIELRLVGTADDFCPDLGPTWVEKIQISSGFLDHTSKGIFRGPNMARLSLLRQDRAKELAEKLCKWLILAEQHSAIIRVRYSRPQASGRGLCTARRRQVAGWLLATARPVRQFHRQC